MKKIVLPLVVALPILQGCAAIQLTSTAISVAGTAAEVAIEAAKVPFKVGGAVIDAVADDDEK